MKSNLFIKFAILVLGLTVSAGAAFADVKIKARQKVSGQTMENTTLIKGKRQRAESMNGQMISITQCDTRRSISINEATQTYQISVFSDGTANNSEIRNPQSKIQNRVGGLVTVTVTTKDTGERKQMFGYTAKHIITTMETNSSPDACSLNKSKMQFDGWYIDADFALDCAANRSYAGSPKSSGGCQDKTEFKTVGAAVKKGYPVLETMTMFDESGKPTMTMESEVVEISKATLDAALFDAPDGYREVKDAAELYAANVSNTVGGNSMKMPTMPTTNAAQISNAGQMPKMPTMPNAPNYGGNDSNQNSGTNQTVKNLSQPKTNHAAEIGAKKAGAIRIGIPAVKTGAVGEGINAQELAGAIQNTFGEFFKGSKVELVPLEAKLASAMANEAVEKQCDFVLYAQVSHKKGGGGGFGGMFKAIAPVMSSVIPMAGGIGGAIAGSVASTVINTAAGAATNVKAKDEITLDIKLNQAGGAAALAKQFKGKAKSGGEDIISPMIEQAAQAILDAVAK